VLYSVHHGNDDRALIEAVLDTFHSVASGPALSGYQEMLYRRGVIHPIAVKHLHHRGWLSV
jgi:hypothetical protein